MTENYPLSQNKLLEDANNIRSLTGSISYIGKARGDSMIWDFMGRRPLSVRDRVVSIKNRPGVGGLRNPKSLNLP